MNFSRRSISASLGSWCVQLVYNPRPQGSHAAAAVAGETVASERASEVQRALLPAFAAIFIAGAAACYALAHFIALPFALRVLMTTLSVVTFVSCGARCGPTGLRRICSAARWPSAFTLAVFALSLRWSDGLSKLLADEPNVQAAVFCGFITLLSILLIGARSGGRLVPVAAPLVPALSLLGLLCLVAVDGLTQACFLVFSAAALYLLCYDRFLRRAAPDLSSGVWNTVPPASRVARGDAAAWALQSVLVSSVWFSLFLSGGALLFWPLQALVPKLAAPRWERGQGENGERKLDYSGGASVMELRGGTHALSDRASLRVTPISGIATGTWRGRIYEKYERSLWSEGSDADTDANANANARAEERSGASRPFRLVRPRPAQALRAIRPHLAPRAGRVMIIDELIEPLGNVANVVYSSGLPLRWQAQPQLFDPTDARRTGDLLRSQSPYEARSFDTQPNLRILDQTPGFDPKIENATNANISPELRRNLISNLQLPSEGTTRAVLRSVVAQVRAGRLPTRTPSQKARAIAEYLRLNCLYSLQGPAVPAVSDATVFFLTDARRGACDMFASSTALLLREMGVPARVATGFLDPQTPESSEEKEGKTIRILRERDAHAWVEYYVPQYGWLSIDPTRNTREVPPTLSGRVADWFRLLFQNLPPALLALPLLGCALLIVGLAWQRRESGADRQAEDERQCVALAYSKSLHLLRRRVPHAPHLAPGEYEERVTYSSVPAAAKQEFAALTHLYLAARYGPAPQATRPQVEACLARFKAALKQRPAS